MLLGALAIEGSVGARDRWRNGAQVSGEAATSALQHAPPDPAKAAFELELGPAPGGVEGDDRRTRIGKIMRKTSMDELPHCSTC